MYYGKNFLSVVLGSPWVLIRPSFKLRPPQPTKPNTYCVFGHLGKDIFFFTNGKKILYSATLKLFFFLTMISHCNEVLFFAVTLVPSRKNLNFGFNLWIRVLIRILLFFFSFSTDNRDQQVATIRFKNSFDLVIYSCFRRDI